MASIIRSRSESILSLLSSRLGQLRRGTHDDPAAKACMLSLNLLLVYRNDIYIAVNDAIEQQLQISKMRSINDIKVLLIGPSEEENVRLVSISLLKKPNLTIHYSAD
jgi:hypothetical protein